MDYKHLLTLSAVIALSACGGSSNSGGTDTGGADGGGGSGSSLTIGDYNKLEPAAIEPTLLEPATEESLKQIMANSLRVGTLLDISLPEAVDTPVATPSIPVASEGGEPSDTNTIVDGVDEADYIKADSEYLYISAQRDIPDTGTGNSISEPIISKSSIDLFSLSPITGWYPETENYLRIVSMDPEQASIEELAEITLEDMPSGTRPELFLNKSDTGETQSVVAVRSHYESINNYICDAPEGASCIALTYYAGDPTAQVSVKPAFNQNGIERFFSFDGNLKQSRKVDNILYLVLDYSPRLYSLFYGITTDDSATQNEKVLASVSAADLLPKVRIDGKEQSYLAANDCYIPKDIPDNVFINGLSSIVAIDLNDASILSSRCVGSPVQGIYASTDAIYLGGSNSYFSNWNSSLTTFHKFELDGGNIEYRATGSVVGTMGWDTAAYSMNAIGDTLRVVTSSREETQEGRFENIHRVSVLRDSSSSDEINLIAQIPNDNRPEVIGKPNEQIESVRFRDDKAYIVTFLRTDPLYVIDLSNPEDPFVAGELEIPGYSEYLHIIDDKTLLGVGYDADSRGVNDGIKVSLFDVSNDTPTEINSIILGDSYSRTPATSNLHAISFTQPTDNQVRFAFPASIYEDRVFIKSGLQQFEINGLSSGEQSLSSAGEIILNTEIGSGSVYSIFYDRSVLYGDSVFYVHESDIWTTFWDQPENASGPY